MSSDMEYIGKAAHDKAESMVKVRVDNVNWEIFYCDPETGKEWVMDHPDSHLQGGGIPRLREVR